MNPCCRQSSQTLDPYTDGNTLEREYQQGGESGGNIDSVAAITRRLGFMLMTMSYEELLVCQNSDTLIFSNKREVSKARKNYKAGE